MRKKLLSLITLALILTTTSCSDALMVTGSTASQQRAVLGATEPVVLEFAKLEVQRDEYGSSRIRLVGVANLQNIAYEKVLNVVYNGPSYFTPDDWTSVQASYLETAPNGYERWSFATPWGGFAALATYQFALNYQVAGQSYWDNNDGQDYNLRYGVDEGRIYDGDHALINNSPVMFNNFYVPGQDLLGYSILVKNLAYDKLVEVVYSTDNWQTSNAVQASYFSSNSQVDGVEIWNAKVPRAYGPTQYYIRYTVNGTTYYDNNQGQNYEVDF